ncbi:MAG: tetratricopeptide repeat protein [Bacteroidia bacterium]
MTDKKHDNLDLDAALANTTHKVEDFYTKNKKNINTAVLVLVVAVAGYFGLKKFYFEPREQEAQVEIFKAQQMFDVDSFNMALKGNGTFKGFADIASEYSGTKAGNLAHYYAGICMLRTGDFAGAVDMLEGFSSDNALIGPLAAGLLGDAYVESGDVEKGAKQYLKAARMSKNKLTAPVFFKKAGIAFEELKNYSDAVDAYNNIKNDYPDAQEATDIDKYIARASALKAEN